MEHPRKTYITVIISGILVSLIPLFLSSQSTLFASFVSTVLMFTWFCVIFSIGISSTREYLNSSINSKSVLIMFLLNLLFPYLILLAFGLSFISSIGIYLLWYVLPSILMVPLILRPDNLTGVLRVTLSSVAAILFWIGFDHRYTMTLFDVFVDLSYILSGFWIVSLMMLGYGYSYGITYHNADTPDKGLAPTTYGMKMSQIGALSASVIIIPVGLLTGFLSWNPVWPGIADVLVGFIGIFLTISLQEEMVFRGVLLNELDNYSLPRGFHPALTLLGTSFLFGLTHWNNEVATYVPHYIILATVAGIAYGWTYRKSGLFGAMLTHTLVDWVWSLFLERIS